ncbi:MAG: rhodanese-like domain-containing protein [Desulforhopalus sp.]|nr:rhodanese-like domain-containing protein [Desulforhopalus sp.]
MKPYLALCHILPLALLLIGFSWGKPTWEDIYGIIARQYPDVVSLEVDQLKAAIDRGQPPVLIDVREKEEFAVSHLAKAVNITRVEDIAYPKDTPIVAYCSVGVRSAAFAKKLGKLGFTNVRNLRGSIFTWANKDYPLWRGNLPVHAVHPYNEKWGTLLNRQFHAYQPE